MALWQRIPLDRKTLFQLMSPDNEQSHAEPLRVGRVDRKDTAAESSFDFLRSIELVLHNNYENLDRLELSGIGLRPEGRGDLYDLFWFPKHPRFCYCADITGEYVYRKDLGLASSGNFSVAWRGIVGYVLYKSVSKVSGNHMYA